MDTISKNLHDTGPGISPEQILVVISDLYHRLGSSGGTIATAESCTGGLISTWLTMPAGSSRFFLGGVCAYANEAKTAILGIDPSVIVRHGAVSETVVKAMASSARDRFKTTWSVGVSGVAGPDGGTVDKPVGTVWCAVAGPTGVEARLLKLTGNRTAIREDAAMHTIRFLMEKIG